MYVEYFNYLCMICMHRLAAHAETIRKHIK